MKKLVSLSIFLCGISGLLHGAEAAPLLPNAFFLVAEPNTDRVAPTYFFTVVSAGDTVSGRSRQVFPELEIQAKRLTGVQFGSSYYIFVPDATENENRILVWRFRDDGTSVIESDGQKFKEIAIESAPVSVAAVEYNNKLYAFVTTVKNDVQMYSLTENGNWEKGESFKMEQFGIPVRPRSQTVVNAIVADGFTYLFMINDDIPNILVATMDKSGVVTLRDQELALTFEVDTLGRLKDYKIVSVIHNKELYLFATGAKNIIEGFVDGWKLMPDGTFKRFVSETSKIPNDLVVIQADSGTWLSMSFFGSSDVHTYQLVDSQLVGPIGTRLQYIPEQIRVVEYRGTPYLVTLYEGRNYRYRLGTYKIGSQGMEDLGSVQLAPSTFLYLGFEPIPYWGQTQAGVSEAIESSTEQLLPLELIKMISEKVTPVE